MNFLHIPLQISFQGSICEISADDQEIGRRLKLFILLGGSGDDPRIHFRSSGTKPFATKNAVKEDQAVRRVRTLGIRALWEDLNRMGSTSRFHFLYNEKLIAELQNAITEQVNLWLEGVATVLFTSVQGDEKSENGVVFETGSMRYGFAFVFALPGKSQMGAFGSWRIAESFDAKLRS
jgi:hypothetical protein